MISPLQNSSRGENRMLVVWYGAQKVDEDNDVAVAIMQLGCTDAVVVVLAIEIQQQRISRTKQAAEKVKRWHTRALKMTAVRGF